ncbi:HD domain-containing phosphohydrolase [Metasolibacillus sp.]|uniref:HD domain-containing phosphohydrolase n=1 Tax=Metasolibacillus sp. TaxID=2703680 RepID=UPI0025D66CAC|nr:HD domain-containing phosphohydrolase [Metasolibacillus sp.]MCT6923126.1 response regulator [Metasolibacillus sp.]MCT6939569.1 response regulator [Metasolibacillus sp.]
MEGIKQAKILIVDDQEYNVSLLERILRRAGFEYLYSTMDPFQAQPLFEEVKPDIVLTDLHMPGRDGIQILQYIRSKDAILPVLMLTADLTPEAKKQAFQEGISDFLTKPIDRIELVLRITNLLQTRVLYGQLREQNQWLEEKVQQRTEELQQAKLEILNLLAKASEYRDDETGEHTQRVGHLSGLIAERLNLPKAEVELIRLAAPLHDIGKIGIPDQILLKPGRFEADEFERMKTHTTIGADILANSVFTTLKMARKIAIAHHEKWDGTGYPNGISGEDIPIEARIVALADFYDALTHERPYKRAWTPEETLAEIKAQRGKHFDPAVVDVFIELFNEQLLVKNG